MTNDNQRQTITKWYSLSEYVDIETGELIPKWKFEKNYYIIKTNKSYEFSNETSTGTRKFIHECRRIGQYKIKF